MKLNKCQVNQIFQKIVVVHCLQKIVKTVNYQIQHPTNHRQLIIRKITRLTKKGSLIKRKKRLKRLGKISKKTKNKLIVKSKRVNKKVTYENKILRK